MYRYYSVMRPIGPGSYPKNGGAIGEIVNFDERFMVPSIGKRVWGYIEYEHPLSEEEAAEYDLIPEDNRAKICGLLCKAIRLTLEGSDLLGLEYDPDYKMVAVHYFSGRCKTIRIAGDTAMDMIRDIVNNIVL